MIFKAVRRSLALIFALAFFVLVSPTFAEAATLTLSPSSGTFNKGCTYQIKIELDTAGASTDGTESNLKFDSTIFPSSSIKITSGTIYQDYPGNSVDPSGKITISGLASFSSPFNGKGTLGTIDVTVADTAPTGTSKISFDFDPNDKTKTTDSNVVENGTVADVLSAVTDGSYTIGSGSCTGGTSSGTDSGSGNGSGSGSGSSGSGSGSSGGKGSTLDPSPSPISKTLPQSGFTVPTTILAVGGGLLVILGIIGFAIL